MVRVVVIAAVVAVVAGAWNVHGALADPATVTLSLSSSAVAYGAPVTLTATVASSLGDPTGQVTFHDADSGDLGTVLLSPTGSGSETASLQISTLPQGVHHLTAVYSPDPPAFFLGITQATSSVQVLTVGTPPPTMYPTQVLLTAPTSVQATLPVTLTATVSRTGTGVGTGTPTGTVDFIDLISGSPVTLGSAPLASGTATLTLPNLAAGPHQIMASYGGDSSDTQSTSATASFTSLPPIDNRLVTTTQVVVTPSMIAAGDVVTIIATINQSVAPGATAPAPPGGRVTFFTNSSLGNNVFLQEVQLGSGPPGVPVAPNQAAFQTTSLQPVQYEIGASYSGDVSDQTSSGSAPLVVLPPRRVSVATYTGETSGIYGHVAHLAGHFTDDSGAPLTGHAVTLALGTQACVPAPIVDDYGNAACSLIVQQDAPGATAVASIAQDLTITAASSTAPFLIAPEGTSAGVDYHLAGNLATLIGTFRTDTGAPLAGQPVTLSLGSVSCFASVVTDALGVATCTVSAPAGHAATLSATFAGATDFLPSSASRVVPLSPTEIAVTTPPPTAAPTMVVSATLTSRGAALGGKPVTLTLGPPANTCTTTTLQNGTASCTLSTPSGLTAPLTAAFAGDADYAASSDTQTVQLLKPTSLTYSGATSGDFGDAVTIAARLTSAGSAVAGQTIAFTLGAQSCSAQTDPNGYGACQIVVAHAAALLTVGASFAQTSTYAASADTAPFTVNAEETALVNGIPGGLPAGAAVQLSATLLEDGTSPVVRRTVSLSVGTATCSGTTNLAGVATCTVTTPTTLGPIVTRAAFAGDAYYAPASLPGQTVLYGATPGGGSFVVGDRSATGAVAYWGSQWWKVNVLSSSPAPSSFKGYAALPVKPSCGSSWSTGPGNSTPPPAGPLPAYIAVIVTSSSSKSGSTISGNSVHVVVVKTNGDYGASPGHDGTGTVVATVC